jgi:hypothetical protein
MKQKPSLHTGMPSISTVAPDRTAGARRARRKPGVCRGVAVLAPAPPTRPPTQSIAFSSGPLSAARTNCACQSVSSVHKVRSPPNATISATCADRRTKLSVRNPSLRASCTEGRPTVDPAAVWASHLPGRAAMLNRGQDQRGDRVDHGLCSVLVAGSVRNRNDSLGRSDYQLAPVRPNIQ